MRLIDADELKHKLNYTAITTAPVWVRMVIDNQPTIVEFEGDINKVIVKGEEYHRIVRCKDCKLSEAWYWKVRRCFLWNDETGVSVRENGYCSYAERRSDE